MNRQDPRTLRYVLITPARNEAAHIEKTLRSMISQTLPPVRWIIVSDGSTDGTDDIVRRYAASHAWIELLRMPERKERHFAGKVYAFNAGYAQVKDLDYDLIGNLDGDVSFESDYFEYLITQFAQSPRLGLAGTNYFENGLKYDFRFSNVEDVAGACQLFRRKCFEGIGGYQPIKGGGIDLVAVLSARMRGWETRSFTDKYLVHYRPQGTASARAWRVHFIDGQHDYRFGGHPVWELFRGAYRSAKKKPFFISGGLLLAGYASEMLKRKERPVPTELIEFRRREQMERLRKLGTRLVGRGGSAASRNSSAPA
jgi:glycosyltransferase involved in cell wall biosynthesis